MDEDVTLSYISKPCPLFHVRPDFPTLALIPCTAICFLSLCHRKSAYDPGLNPFGDEDEDARDNQQPSSKRSSKYRRFFMILLVRSEAPRGL